jgi:hypothetical protein
MQPYLTLKLCTSPTQCMYVFGMFHFWRSVGCVNVRMVLTKLPLSRELTVSAWFIGDMQRCLQLHITSRYGNPSPGIEKDGSSRNTFDLHAGSAQFESRTGHQLS